MAWASPSSPSTRHRVAREAPPALRGVRPLCVRRSASACVPGRRRHRRPRRPRRGWFGSGSAGAGGGPRFQRHADSGFVPTLRLGGGRRSGRCGPTLQRPAIRLRTRRILRQRRLRGGHLPDAPDGSGRLRVRSRLRLRRPQLLERGLRPLHGCLDRQGRWLPRRGSEVRRSRVGLRHGRHDLCRRSQFLRHHVRFTGDRVLLAHSADAHVCSSAAGFARVRVDDVLVALRCADVGASLHQGMLIRAARAAPARRPCVGGNSAGAVLVSRPPRRHSAASPSTPASGTLQLGPPQRPPDPHVQMTPLRGRHST